MLFISECVTNNLKLQTNLQKRIIIVGLKQESTKLK